MAQEGLFFAPLARVSPRTQVPIRALVAQAVWASVLVLSGSFDTLTDYAMFAILAFVGMATASVFVFRRRWPDVERPIARGATRRAVAGAGRDDMAAGQHADDRAIAGAGGPGVDGAGAAVLLVLVAKDPRG